ncbi:MAG: helix-turn-helix transcriptional regulator [Prevotella sp.]|jgi:transcriptional regulator with XRE-family HTH domain|nr:helix-turn-helix transcriptional regulator [Prevotella sp.]
MANNKTKPSKMTRSPKKPKTKFGRYCAEVRLKLGWTIADMAERMSCTQPYITAVENGTEKLTFEYLSKWVKAYIQVEPNKIQLQTLFQLLYEVISTLEKVEIDLTKTTIANRENLNRLITAFLLNQEYPQTGGYDYLYWADINGVIETLAQKPNRIQYDIDRIISKEKLES